jgi:hypothetical protein
MVPEGSFDHPSLSQDFLFIFFSVCNVFHLDLLQTVISIEISLPMTQAKAAFFF